MDTPASRLKWARAQRGLTQAALAKAACVLTRWIDDLEEGRRAPPHDLSGLAAALGVRPAWLETGQGDWKAAAPGSSAPEQAPGQTAGPLPAGALGETIVQLGMLLSPLSPLARASIAPLLARMADDPALAAEAARMAEAIARS